jgi:hypothetical protein
MFMPFSLTPGSVVDFSKAASPPVALSPRLDGALRPRCSAEVVEPGCWQLPFIDHLCDPLMRDAEVPSHIDHAEPHTNA